MKRRSVREILHQSDWADLAAEVSYDAKALAKLCRGSVRTLEREFHDGLQTSPQRWLDWFRALKAGELLKSGIRTKEVAHLLGYKQPSHLCRKIRLAQELFTMMSLTDKFLSLSPKEVIVEKSQREKLSPPKHPRPEKLIQALFWKVELAQKSGPQTRPF